MSDTEPSDGGTLLDTLPSSPSPGWLTFEQALRLVAATVMLSAVAAAAVGLLGVRSRIASGEAGGVVATVEYAHVARPGLAAPFSVTVESRDGTPLPPSLEVAVTLDYLELFDENGLDPQPASEHTDDGDLVWSFEVPPGVREFSVSFDGRIEPAVQWKRTGRVAVTAGDRQVADVDITTWVTP